MTTNFTAHFILPDMPEQVPVLINSEFQTIRDLVEYLREEFEIKEKFTLHINECVLPLAESINIIKETDVIRVKTETAPYLVFMPNIRIKVNLRSYYCLWDKCGYLLIPPNTKTVADLINCISKLYRINNNFSIRLINQHHQLNILEYLCDIQNEDVVSLTPVPNTFEL